MHACTNAYVRSPVGGAHTNVVNYTTYFLAEQQLLLLLVQVPGAAPPPLPLWHEVLHHKEKCRGFRERRKNFGGSSKTRVKCMTSVCGSVRGLVERHTGRSSLTETLRVSDLNLGRIKGNHSTASWCTWGRARRGPTSFCYVNNPVPREMGNYLYDRGEKTCKAKKSSSQEHKRRAAMYNLF